MDRRASHIADSGASDDYVRARLNGLDSGTIEIAADLRQVLDALIAPPPRETFFAALHQTLVATASGSAVEATDARAVGGRRHPRLGLRRASPFVAALVVVVVGVILAARIGGATRPANALEIVQRASQSGTDIGRVTDSPFVVTSRFVMTSGQDQGVNVFEVRRWVSPPHRWRSEGAAITYSPDGSEQQRTTAWILVSDGQTQWSFVGGVTRAEPYNPNAASPNTSLGMGNFGLGLNEGSLATLLDGAARCFSPRYLADATVVGRRAHIIDLGPDRCPHESPNGQAVVIEPSRIWVDADTFTVLKWTGSAPAAPWVTVTYEVTTLVLGASIEPDTFTFEEP